MRSEYRNKQGVCFDIEIQDARVPQEADYWGYYMKASERETQRTHVFMAMIRKNLCRTKVSADVFLLGDPVRYLKTSLLDSYEDGEHMLVWPDMTHGWVIT